MKLLSHRFILIIITLKVFCEVHSVHESRSAKHSKRTFLGLGFEIVGGIFGSINANWNEGLKSIDHWDLETHNKDITLRNCGVRSAKNYIVGGEEAFENEFPFIVSILYNRRISCGGAIINHWWIITAAHCFLGQHISRFSVIIGSHTPTDGKKYSISKLIIHNGFNEETMHSDIALIKVDRPIPINDRVNGICLPAKKYEEPTGHLTVVGWGKLRYGEHEKGAETLQKVDLPIISDKQCANMFSFAEIPVFRSYLCTYAVGKDSCEGDSGGPAFQYINGKAVLIGIVSFGYECADAYPGAYTQVSWYVDWIASNIY